MFALKARFLFEYYRYFGLHFMFSSRITHTVLSILISKIQSQLQSSKNASEKPERDLIPGKDVVFVFKVYPPYAYDPHNRGSKVNHNMEIAILGHQTLNLLCDKIICDDMLMEVGGDISENPDTPVRQRLGVSLSTEKLSGTLILDIINMRLCRNLPRGSF